MSTNPKLAFYQCFIRLFYFFVKQPYLFVKMTLIVLTAIIMHPARFRNAQSIHNLGNIGLFNIWTHKNHCPASLVNLHSSSWVIVKFLIAAFGPNMIP